MSRGPASAAGWLTDAEEQPRPGAVSGTGIHRRARVFRAYVWTATVLTPVLLLATLAALTGPAAATATDPPNVTSPGRAVATERLLDWLSGTDPGLPGGRMLLWSGARTAPPPDSVNRGGTEDVALAVEVDAFVVVDTAGNQFTAEIQVALHEHGAATVLSGPSLTPLPVLDPAAARNAGTWPGRGSGKPTAPVAAAVQAWAAAYTSGDPAALRLTVGDPDPARGYLPLPGVAAADTVVGPSTVLDPTTTAVRVELAITWATAEHAGPAAAGVTTPGEKPAAAAKIAFDVLVTGADTAAPRVVAWGGPGNGPELTPFRNAVPISRTAPNNPAMPQPPTYEPPTFQPDAPVFVPPTTSHGPAG